MKKVKEKKFIRFFKYDDEYISGWTYWGRSIVNSLLIIILGLGLYLQSVNTYKRGKSLGYKSNEVWAIFGFIHFILYFIPILFLIPFWYLLFSNGNNYDRITSFNELNNSDGFYTLKNKPYSGNAFIKKANKITDEFNFIRGKKTLHKSYYKFPVISSQEDWFYENYNEHPNGVINQYCIWHHNGNLVKKIITNKNGDKTEERFDENDSNFIKSEVID